MSSKAVTLSILIAIVISFANCSKKQVDTTRRDPWLAQQPDAQTGIGSHARYALDTRCEVNVELPAREATPRGSFRVCKGEIDVNLSDLAQSRGTISIDLGSIEMRGEGDGGRSDDFTQRAQNWLDIGASRPEAERERLRWATFTLVSANDLSSEAAHSGKLGRDEPPTPASKAAEAPVEDDGGKDHAASRAVTLTVKGDLLLHGVRVELSAPVRAVFHYSDRAAADRTPDRMRLETRHPISVLLKLHDIKPRSAAGTELAEETKLFGAKVGTEAKISFSLGAGPARLP